MASAEVAFVTGASSGIGQAVAARLGARGASVGLFSRSEPGLSTTAELVRETGGTPLVLAGDVTDEPQVRAAVRTVVDELGPLRTTVACAGVVALGTVPEMEIEDWNRVIAVNLTGVFLTARHAIPAMVEAGGGTFVGMSSDAGVLGGQGWGAYCASKHGVIGLVRALALDHGPQGVRCNVIAPGFVETPMVDQIFEGAPEEEIERWKKAVPLGRFARPAEVAAAIAYLTSEDASYVNGQVHNLDGGTTAGVFDAAAV